jgi:alanine racemase
MSGGARAEIVVDLDAIRHNVRTLRELTGVAMITVVKADGYGHGMLPVARAAREAGAEWLAVATLDEVRRLRDAGDTGRLLTWLTVPGEQYDDAIRADVDLTAYSVAELDEIAAAATHVGAPARVQLKVDTGLHRGGASRAQWEPFLARARAGEEAGDWTVTGIWSHLACADEPAHPANDDQQATFDDALALAADLGLEPEVRHLANSAAAILRPQSRYDAVRVGLATYGLDPAPTVDHGTDLRPAMTVRAELALVKQLEAGDAVSYGHTWTSARPSAWCPPGTPRGSPSRAATASR